MLKKRIENPLLRGLVEWLLAIGLAVLLFLFLRFFVFRVAHVKGPSMEPTLSNGDMVVLNRLALLLFSPRVGDIVAFPYPANPSEFYIKRVVAVPGDIVEFREGAFFVNGNPLEDDFSHEPVLDRGDMDSPITVEEGYYFVLGDNRNGSLDSRFSSVGTVPANEMIGRVALRVWPFGRFGTVD